MGFNSGFKGLNRLECIETTAYEQDESRAKCSLTLTLTLRTTIRRPGAQKSWATAFFFQWRLTF